MKNPFFRLPLLAALLWAMSCHLIILPELVKSARDRCKSNLEESIEFGGTSCRSGIFLFGLNSCTDEEPRTDGTTRGPTPEEFQACQDEKKHKIELFCLLEYSERNGCNQKSDAPFSDT